jgi:hypothetical protein
MHHTHHATVYLGTELSVLPSALQQPSVDVEHRLVEQWGIEDSRQLAEAAAQRPVAAEQRVFVIVTSALTHEAQNALLKLFEDPPPTAVFYLLIPSIERLLETVRSRVVVVRQPGAPALVQEWQAFKTQTIAEQLAESAERARVKDSAWQRIILAAAAEDVSVPTSTRLLVETYRERSGVSRKMLIEEVALSLASR